MITLACSTCQTTMALGAGDAAGWSIMFLLVVILSILTGVVFFLARLMRRDAAALDPELCDDYVSPQPSR